MGKIIDVDFQKKEVHSTFDYSLEMKMQSLEKLTQVFRDSIDTIAFITDDHEIQTYSTMALGGIIECLRENM